MKRTKQSSAARVAVLMLLAGCGASGAADVTAVRVTEDVAEQFNTSAAPADVVAQVFDLCDDEQAIAAGLDGGDLAGDRATLGIRCDAGGVRYGSLDQFGNLTLGTTDEFVDSPTDREIERRAESTLILGYRPASIVSEAIRQIKGNSSGLAVLDSSLNHVDGFVYGLVVNSGDRLATRLTVSYFDDFYIFPLSLQPGEASPFMLKADRRLDTGDLTLEADLSDQVDLNRSVLIYQAPGRWSGPASDVPAPAGLVDLSEAGATVQYYETTLAMAVPSDPPDLEAAVRLNTIPDPIAVVAFLDEDGQVVGLENAPVVVVDSQGRASPAASFEFGETVTTGFLIPSGASDFVLQVGGVAG